MGSYEKSLYATANYACDLAYENALPIFKTFKGGRMAFFPCVDVENGRIGVGVNPDYHYLIYQERGFASFPMSWAYGRTIPLMINGQIVFRKCTGVNRFQSGHKNYWQRGVDGKLIPEFKQKRSWVHPGLPPKHFMAEAIEQAIKDKSRMIKYSEILEHLGAPGEKIYDATEMLVSHANKLREKAGHVLRKPRN